MHLFLLILSLVSVFNSLMGAPAVSSVHVTFVSGNKATHYSHDSGGDGSIMDFSLLDKGHSGVHTVKRRSATKKPSIGEGGLRIHKRTRQPTTTTSTAKPSTMIPELELTSTTDFLRINAVGKVSKPSNSMHKSRERKRVAFIPEDQKTDKQSFKPILKSNIEKSLKAKEVQQKEENLETTTAKIKDTKAVKRSPQFHDNFIGFNFPDFDEFGGNDFGTEDFGSVPSNDDGHHGHGDGRGVESLAPEGIFLPPSPTQASNYVENDPYLAEPEVAHYAAQHVPYFHEFPHKRTVLALNERREENGLEPNILRSLRPFFPFFEINNPRRARYGLRSHRHRERLAALSAPFFFRFHPELNYHYFTPPFYYLHNIGPSGFLYASGSENMSQILSPPSSNTNTRA